MKKISNGFKTAFQKAKVRLSEPKANNAANYGKESNGENKKEHASISGKSIYDGIKLTESGADIIVIALSVILIVFFVIAVITA